jgi:hypothetical protein
MKKKGTLARNELRLETTICKAGKGRGENTESRRYRRTHYLVTTGWKEKLIHQKEVKATYKLESIEGEMSQDKEIKSERKGHSHPREYKGKDMSKCGK